MHSDSVISFIESVKSEGATSGNSPQGISPSIRNRKLRSHRYDSGLNPDWHHNREFYLAGPAGTSESNLSRLSGIGNEALPVWFPSLFFAHSLFKKVSISSVTCASHHQVLTICREHEVPAGAVQVWVNLRQNLTLVTVPVVGVWQYGAEFEVFDYRST